jgi:hypothetical protein
MHYKYKNDIVPETKRKTKRKWYDIKIDNVDLDNIAISVRSHKLLEKLLTENPKLEQASWASCGSWDVYDFMLYVGRRR